MMLRSCTCRMGLSCPRPWSRSRWHSRRQRGRNSWWPKRSRRGERRLLEWKGCVTTVRFQVRPRKWMSLDMQKLCYPCCKICKRMIKE